MQVETYDSAMHPEAEHVYAIDFTDLLQRIGGDNEIISGVPTVSVIDTAPTGFTAVYAGIDPTERIVYFTAGVATGEHDNTIYEGKGQTACIQANIVTTSSPQEVQQVKLVINDQC